jgi:competence protein ComEA
MSESSPQQLPFLDRYGWIILIAVGVLTLGVFGYLLTNEEDPVRLTINPPAPTVTPIASPSPEPLEIYVTGAVAQPEIRLTMEPGSRVEDAIQAAGGALENANLSAVNLAARLQDGDQIHVPGIAEAASEEAVEITATPSTPRLLDLNTATQAELEALPDIGEATAQDILAYREENGPFTSVDQLDEVPGIGPATLEKLRPLVTVEAP